MEEINVFYLMNTNYKTLTKSEKKVADFINAEREGVLYNAITDISEACSVGDTTVLRFCKKIGFNSFQKFKMALARSIQANTTTKVVSEGDITPDDSVEEIAYKLKRINTNIIDETISLMDYEAIDATVDSMKEARRIIFFGVGSSGITALEGKNRFMRINPCVEAGTEGHYSMMMASLMTKEDVMIAFSHSGSSIDAVEVLKRAKQAGAKTVAITRYAKSPITSHADIVILTGGQEGPMQGGALTTKMIQLYIIDILYTHYYHKTWEQSERHIQTVAEAISDKLY